MDDNDVIVDEGEAAAADINKDFEDDADNEDYVVDNGDVLDAEEHGDNNVLDAEEHGDNDVLDTKEDGDDAVEEYCHASCSSSGSEVTVVPGTAYNIITAAGH